MISAHIHSLWLPSKDEKACTLANIEPCANTDIYLLHLIGSHNGYACCLRGVHHTGPTSMMDEPHPWNMTYKRTTYLTSCRQPPDHFRTLIAGNLYDYLLLRGTDGPVDAPAACAFPTHREGPPSRPVFHGIEGRRPFKTHELALTATYTPRVRGRRSVDRHRYRRGRCLATSAFYLIASRPP